MNSVKQIVFDEGCTHLMSGDFIGFAEAIINLHTNHSLCQCFFEEQPETIWSFLLAEAVRLEVKNHWSDFNINLSKGFLFLQNMIHDKAYYHLTRAVNIRPLSDVAYCLRSRVSERHNKKCMQDATEAVLLCSSATNYFALASIVSVCNNLTIGGAVLEENEQDSCEIFNLHVKKAIILYDIAINQDNSFSCAYAKKANMHMELKEYQTAIELYTSSLKIKPNYWPWYRLWTCFEKISNTSRDEIDCTPMYYEMITLLENAVRSSDANRNLYLELADVNERLGNYRKAVEYNEIYLNFFPDNIKVEGRVFDLSENLSRKMDSNGLSLARQGLYSDALFCFNVYLKKYKFRTLEMTDFYLKSLLMDNSVFIDASDNNPVCEKLKRLKSNYFEKNKLNIELTLDEIGAGILNVYNLNSKINFGEYSGYLVRDVMQENPSYLLRCIINWQCFALHNSIIVDKIFMQDNVYIKAVEVNVIKNIFIGQWNSEIEDEKEVESEYYRNYTWEEETFNALTDGQLGDWDDFGGDIDDARTSMGSD